MDALSFVMLFVVGSCWTPEHNHHIQIKNNISTELCNDRIFVICSHAPFNTELYCLLLQLCAKTLFVVFHINNKILEAEIVNTTRNQIVKGTVQHGTRWHYL